MLEAFFGSMMELKKTTVWDGGFDRSRCGCLLDFAVQCVTPQKLVVFHEFKLCRCVFLIFVGRVATHAGYTTVLLLCALDRNDHACAFCFLSHVCLFRAILCAVCLEPGRTYGDGGMMSSAQRFEILYALGMRAGVRESACAG